MFHFSRLNAAGRNITCIRTYHRFICNSKLTSSNFKQYQDTKLRHWSTFQGIVSHRVGLQKHSSRLPWNQISKRSYSELPPHQTLVLPALSPTMETGSLVSWEKKVGDEISEGDLLCEIETDKATMGFEAGEAGYLAKLLVQQGTRDLPLGTPLCIIVESRDEVAAFEGVSAEELSKAAGGGAAKPMPAESTASASAAGEAPKSAASSLPPHQAVPLPALSPTMESGSIVSWEKKEGEFVKEGDLLAEIETDKATMGFEASDEGYLAKVLVAAGEKNVPLGTLLCVLVENEEDVAKFASVTAADLGAPPTSAMAAAPPEAPAAAAPSSSSASSSVASATPATPTATTSAPGGSGGRVKASPYARRLAKEKGVSLESILAASGPDGRVVAADVEKAAAAAAAAPPAAATTATATAQPAAAGGGDFVDIPLTGMRATIAKRLTASKQSIPHYYLTVQVGMDRVLQVRKEANRRLAKRGIKLSVNDFIIKAAAVALGRVPECNSSWQDTFIRQHSRADICVAVATDNGLITPIIFNADAKGLLSINSDVVSLAEKARGNRLKPAEFQGGTFTVSNLGMFGIQSFSAIINPPQACILAVGGAQRVLLPPEDGDTSAGLISSTVIQCTLCCDHRVVDGAVGARWLSEFKQCLEEPYDMLL